MATLLHLQASPRGRESASRQVARAFLEAYRAAHGGDRVETLDLFSAELPVFDAPAAEAKYALLGGPAPRGPAQEKWREVIAAIDHFKSADKLLISTPMWNFSIPYRLKHYIDIIVQPGLTVAVGPEGYKGLVTGRPAMLILARGGSYPPGAAYDMQKPYLELILRFIGFEDIRSLVVEPTLAEGPQVAGQRIEAAAAEARRLASAF